MKIASLVTGVLSLVLSFVPVIGTVLGIIAIYTAYKSERPIAGMGAAGLACGIVGAVLSVILTITTGVTMCVAMR